jgi:uncharacterized protein (TIGR00725 family)
MRGKLRIAVIGSGTADRDDVDGAYAVGKALAEAGAVLVCGGLGGVMEAACRGAEHGGGDSIGLLPGSDPSEANEFVKVAVATGLGEARNVLVVHNADAVIAVGGEFGTLSEIALALKAGIPVIGLDTWSLGKGGTEVTAIHVVASPQEAVDVALAQLRS